MRLVGLAAIAAGAVLAVRAQNQQYAMPCTYDRPDLGVTWDLTDYPSGYIRIPAGGASNTAMAIGVCNNLQSFPGSIVQPAVTCTTTRGDDGSITVATTPGPAYIWTPGVPGSCQRLGDDAANGQLYINVSAVSSVTSRTSRMYAHGVDLLYQNGDMCLSDPVAKTFTPLSINVHFTCDESAGVKAPVVATETTTCQWNLFYPSVQGCPTQCRPDDSYHVCNNQGICGYDTTHNTAKCYCNTGYQGQYCDQQGTVGAPPPPSYAPNIAGGFFGGLFAGLAVAVGFLMVRAKLSGGSFVDGLDFSKAFTYSKVGAGARAVASDGFYAEAAPGPAFAGAAGPASYVAPELPPAGATPVFAAPTGAAESDGPLLIA